MEPFHQNIREFLLFFQLCAFSPFGQTSLQNRLLMFYSFTTIIIIFLLFISAFFIYNLANETTMLSIIDTAVFSGHILTQMLVVIQSYTTRYKQMLLLEKIGEIDTTFRAKFYKTFHYRNYRRRYRIKFGIIIAFVAIINCYFIYGISQLINTPKLMYYWYHVFYPIVIIRLRCIQNTFYVDLLGERFKLVNAKLMDIINCDNFAKNQSKLIVCIDFVYANKVGQIIQGNYNDVIVLKDIYGKLWSSVNLINDCFGWSNLAIITQFFVEFVSHGYWLFAGLESLTSKDKVLGAILALMPVIVVLSTLCYSCFVCKDAAQSTGGLIHKLEQSIDNEPYNDIVRNFSLQIYHQPIIISANGFFEINLDLLGSIVAATVTYLVILIQFQLNDAGNKNAIVNASVNDEGI